MPKQIGSPPESGRLPERGMDTPGEGDGLREIYPGQEFLVVSPPVCLGV